MPILEKEISLGRSGKEDNIEPVKKVDNALPFL